MKTLFLGLVAMFATSAFAQDGLIEIKQDQGTQYDTFTRTSMTEKDGYTEYVATDHLQVAFKMMGDDVDVKGCDYLLIKFAEAVPAGWNVSVWDGQENQALTEGITEWKYEIPADIQESGKLPQICILTIYDPCTYPLTLKVVGVYKHSTASAISSINIDKAEVSAIYNAAGKKQNELQSGINIVKMTDGTVKKVLVK